MTAKTLLHYEIGALIGKGGMGEVYRALDTKLGREVALKVLPVDVSNDPERMARFRREAKLLASLNHPNIAAIYGLEEDAGTSFFVMELVEGEDLAARLTRGALPAETALEIARQLAEGLEEAHAKGIVHRDLKPANVQLSPEGKVKILDFGLARAFTGEDGTAEVPADSPTITAAMTHPGVVLGTASYMSPEQARGEPVDARTDIWAFGVILWEMLRGRRLFDGKTTSDALAGVLKSEIDLEALPPETPSVVHRVLRRCLERDRHSRLHSIADARIELEDSKGRAASAAEARGEARDLRDSRFTWVLLAVVVLTSVLLMTQPWRRSTSPPAPPMRLSILLPEESHLSLLDWEALALAPDGGGLATILQGDLGHEVVFYEFESGEYRVLSEDPLATGICFSPDSRWVAYFADGRMWKVSVEGGAPVEIAPVSHWRGASWGDDGYVYYSPTYASGVYRVDESGRNGAERLTLPDTLGTERTHRWPQALPGGRGAVFTVGMADSPGDYEDAEIAVYDARDGTTRYLGIRGATARYLEGGYLLVARKGSLLAARFDLDRLELTSSPIPVFDGIAGDAASGIYYFDLSPQGHLVYVRQRAVGPQRNLAWVDREGEVERLDLPLGPYRYPRIAPSGRTALFIKGEGHGGNDDLYLIDLQSLAMHRFTFNQGSVTGVWSPDGKWIYYADLKRSSIMVRDATGSTVARHVVRYVNTDLPASISGDGRFLFVTVIGGPKLAGVYAMDLADTNSYGPVVQTPAAEWGSMVSPDGKWIAYISDETGREEVFVQPFPTTGSKWQISDRGGRAAVWNPDGTGLVYMNGDRFYEARITTDPVFRAETPRLLFEHPMDSAGTPRANYDISPLDGRLLVVEADESRRWKRMEVVLNWARRLEELP